MLVKELKEKLKSYGLSTAGLKPELEARLETYENELNEKDPNRVVKTVINSSNDLNDTNETETEQNNESVENINNNSNITNTNETIIQPETTASMIVDNTPSLNTPATAANDDEKFKGNETILVNSDEQKNGQDELQDGIDNSNMNGNGVDHTENGTNGLDEDHKQEQEQLQQQQSEDEQRKQQELKEEDDQRAKEEAERLEKIKIFVDSQSDLYKQIFSQTKELLNINVCQKLEECINLNKLALDDLDNQNLMDILQDLNENCLDAFDSHLNSQPEEAQTSEVKPETTNTEAPVANAEGAEVKSDEVQSTETSDVQDKPAQPTVKQTNVDLLIKSLSEWRRQNINKLTKRNKNKNGRNRDRYQQKKASRPGPNEEKLKEILERTGYSHEVSSGQRKYGGPPPDWPTATTTATNVNTTSVDVKTEELTQITTDNEMKVESVEEQTTTDDNKKENGGEEGMDGVTSTTTTTTTAAASATFTPATPTVLHPGVGCECFVGKLPRDLFEDELIPVFEQQGKIWDLRLMIDPSTGYSKGYCFVTYCDKESAALAAKNLNDHEIRPGKSIRVNVSVANIRLFIGNIPKTKSREELKNEFGKIVEGMSDLIIFTGNETAAQLPTDDKIKNRGFCFIEFIDHKSASVAKRKLSKFNRVLNREIAVDWADPHEEPDEETMSKVKVLYVKNLSAEVTEEEVQKLFETYGKLERVRKMKDYAFIHFEQREECMKAMEEQQGKVFGKNPLEISLARPLTDKKKQAQQKRNENDHHSNRNRNGGGGGNWNNNNNQINGLMSGQNGRGFNNRNGGGNRGFGGNQRNNYGNNNNSFNGNRGYGGGNQNNNFNRGGGGGGRGGGGGMNRNNNGNGNMGNYGNRSFGNNNNNNNMGNGKMNNKRKNGGMGGANGGGDNKKFRFNQNNNNNNNNNNMNLMNQMDASNWNNNVQNQQISYNNQLMNGNGEQANNEWYQDNFNTSSQWI